MTFWNFLCSFFGMFRFVVEVGGYTGLLLVLGVVLYVFGVLLTNLLVKAPVGGWAIIPIFDNPFGGIVGLGTLLVSIGLFNLFVKFVDSHP